MLAETIQFLRAGLSPAAFQSQPTKPIRAYCINGSLNAFSAFRDIALGRFGTPKRLYMAKPQIPLQNFTKYGSDWQHSIKSADLKIHHAGGYIKLAGKEV